VRIAAVALVLSSLAGVLALTTGCDRNKEVTAPEVKAAMAAAGYTVTPKAADRDAPASVTSSCFDMAGSGSKQSVCVWRCTEQEVCTKAMRDMMESGAPKKHVEVTTVQVDRCVIVERDCTGPSCAKLHDDITKTHLRW
jgi:hypothetical protein